MRKYKYLKSNWGKLIGFFLSLFFVLNFYQTTEQPTCSIADIEISQAAKNRSQNLLCHKKNEVFLVVYLMITSLLFQSDLVRMEILRNLNLDKIQSSQINAASLWSTCWKEVFFICLSQVPLHWRPWNWFEDVGHWWDVLKNILNIVGDMVQPNIC